MSDKELEVYASCVQSWIRTKKVKIENVESNQYDQDVITYVCPYCMQEHKSVAIIVDK